MDPVGPSVPVEPNLPVDPVGPSVPVDPSVPGGTLPATGSAAATGALAAAMTLVASAFVVALPLGAATSDLVTPDEVNWHTPPTRTSGSSPTWSDAELLGVAAELDQELVGITHVDRLADPLGA